MEKLAALAQEYEAITDQMSRPETLQDQETYKRLSKTHAELSDVVAGYERLLRVEEELKDVELLLADSGDDGDAELMALARDEQKALETEKDDLVQRLTAALVPKDPMLDKNVIVEIRAGAGGEEAALFAGTLLRMYHRYADNRQWRTELLSENATGLGGFKEVIMMIYGDGAYSDLQYESGVHRVQRVPTTESGGRIHTSTVTVAVLPEAEEVEVDIHPQDLRVDVYRSSGPGGQSVNTTDSAVRITHLPTGLVVSCQDEKSQHKNRDKAMRILRARLYDKMQQEQAAALAEERKDMVGTGDRSERIRTYNYPQGRVTDHRIGLTLHRLEEVLEGELDELIDALKAHQAQLQLQQRSASAQ